VEHTLEGKVAVITGSGNGIGRASALRLAQAGAIICVVDADDAGGSATATAIGTGGGTAQFFSTDVSRPESVRSMADEVLGRFGKVDILVNDAAIFPRSFLVDMDWSEWERVIAVNLHGPFLCTKAFLSSMVSRRAGRIVNVASGLGVTGGTKAAHYATSKGGLIAFTKSLALELAPYGITANALVPGLSDTGMPRRGQSEQEIQAMLEQIPLKRLAQPEEIAEFLAFLVGPSSAYVTGQTLFVNGGWIMP
jgi:NAD(P)-dependent dehydrogenase (short-subunit alcohol dehydrogenase family)